LPTIGSSRSDKKAIVPADLKGLTQAIFVLKALQDGKSENEIVDLFKGDQQIVQIWTSFLAHNHWMEHPDGKWEVTPKGKEWIERRLEK
jgi:hypothetical protein